MSQNTPDIQRTLEILTEWEGKFARGLTSEEKQVYTKLEEMCENLNMRYDRDPSYFYYSREKDQPPDTSDPTCLHEDLAISFLMQEEVLFHNYRPYVTNPWDKGEDRTVDDTATVVLFVQAGDVFAWGVAEARNLPGREALSSLLNEYLKYGLSGRDRWLCRLDNEKPQYPVMQAMKAAGAWDEEMEALPDNYYDSQRKKEAK